jgi:hypothetical protein
MRRAKRSVNSQTRELFVDSPLLAQAKTKLQEMLEAPVVRLGEVSTMANLILSVEETMKHDTAMRQHSADVIHADQCIEAFSESVHALNKCFENLTMRGVLIDDIEFILSPKETLLLLVGKLQEAKERQVAKDAQYMQAAE